jgi:hypothetical protein
MQKFSVNLSLSFKRLDSYRHSLSRPLIPHSSLQDNEREKQLAEVYKERIENLEDECRKIKMKVSELEAENKVCKEESSAYFLKYQQVKNKNHQI